MISMSIVIVGASWTDSSLILGKRGGRGREGGKGSGYMNLVILNYLVISMTKYCKTTNFSVLLILAILANGMNNNANFNTR